MTRPKDWDLVAEGEDVELEALMARIRDRIKENGSASLGQNAIIVQAPLTPSRAGDALQAQAEFNKSLTDALRLIGLQVARMHKTLAALEAAEHTQSEENAHRAVQEEKNTGLLAEVDSQLARLSMTLEQLASAQLPGFEQKVNRQLDELRIRLLRAERAARGEPRAAGAPASTSPRIAEGTTDGLKEPGRLPEAFDYFMFEQRFRGTGDDIRQRQAAYVELFREKANVLDLGCGRGEFVELLAERGVNVKGVDADQDMVDFGRDRGLNVVRADILEYLAGLPAASVDGIFAAQVVEHLTYAQIARLISLCAQKLIPGGIMVAETVNPQCSFALGEFYLDPTHVRPLPPQLLEFMFDQASFKVHALRFSMPVRDSGAPPVLEFTTELPPVIGQYQDYAVIAYKLNGERSL